MLDSDDQDTITENAFNDIISVVSATSGLKFIAKSTLKLYVVLEIRVLRK